MIPPGNIAPVQPAKDQQLSMFGFIVLIIYYPASTLFMFWLTYSQIQGCNLVCIGPQSHVRTTIVPSCILYKLPFMYLLCMAASFMNGYAMRLPKVSLDSSPTDIVREIRTNISTWAILNSLWSIATSFVRSDAQLRFEFAEHIARPHCTGYELFGPLPETLTIVTFAFVPCLHILAYLTWTENIGNDGRFGSSGEKRFHGTLFHRRCVEFLVGLFWN